MIRTTVLLDSNEDLEVLNKVNLHNRLTTSITTTYPNSNLKIIWPNWHRYPSLIDRFTTVETTIFKGRNIYKRIIQNSMDFEANFNKQIW